MCSYLQKYKWKRKDLEMNSCTKNAMVHKQGQKPRR